MIFVPPTTQTSADMLAETHRLYQRSAEKLAQMINAFESGEETETKVVTQVIRELRQSLDIALQERTYVEKISKTLAAGGDGYDLDGARDEIGRRLSKLRAVRGDGSVSGGAER